MNFPTPVPLPYSFTGKLLSPLPTSEEIHNAQFKLSPRREVWDRSGVCSIRDYVIKYGRSVGENEGNALLFLEKNHIPAPRLYAMYREASSGYLYLIMERFAGHNLESLWAALSSQDKSSIATQLRSIFTQIRSLNPPCFIGGVCGGGVPSALFRTEDPNSKINGPFQTASEVTSALAIVLQDNEGGWITDYLKCYISGVLRDSPVRFTHGDLHMRNIIVEKIPGEPSLETYELGNGKNDEQWSYQVRGIVDYESAGWYPAYWDYVTAIARPQPANDWPMMVDVILEPYAPEACAYLLLLKELQFIY
ncbi:Ff.00g036080.m01.CDS01 [Fusarium sp. VM40]|nr:Ff.00g036080.m01.CDS01 [Fusarium sp. VM40]